MRVCTLNKALYVYLVIIPLWRIRDDVLCTAVFNDVFNTLLRILGITRYVCTACFEYRVHSDDLPARPRQKYRNPVAPSYSELCKSVCSSVHHLVKLRIGVACIAGDKCAPFGVLARLCLKQLVHQPYRYLPPARAGKCRKTLPLLIGYHTDTAQLLLGVCDDVQSRPCNCTRYHTCGLFAVQSSVVLDLHGYLPAAALLDMNRQAELRRRRYDDLFADSLALHNYPFINTKLAGIVYL